MNAAGLERLAGRLHRYRYWLAAASLAAGLASFLLIHRDARLAQWLSVVLLLSWGLMLAEGLLGEWLARWLGWRQAPLVLLRYLTQAVHQESFFFTLPFFFATTTWGSGQALFTGSIALAALCSMLDPLYFSTIAARRSLYLGFHALAVFLVMLTALPLLWQLTTAESMALAAAAVGLLALPSLLHVIRPDSARRWLVLLALAAGLALLAWGLRFWVPPATLWVTHGAMTQRLDAADRLPGFPVTEIGEAELRTRGLYGFSAIRAPRGLREPVVHVWKHEGRVVDRIPLTIVGGRSEGYRAWSHKRSFPAEVRGQWQLEVLTEAGQLIGVIRFRVS